MSNIRTFKRIELEGCLFEKHKTELEKQKKDILKALTKKLKITV